MLAEDQPSIPPAVLEKMAQLQNGELTQLEKIKLADQLQHAGAKKEALALYEENLPLNPIKKDIPSEAYLNYGTTLLEQGEEQKGLAVYDLLSSSLDPKEAKTKKIKDMLENNTVNYFQVQEQKKEQENKDKKDEKDKKENKDNQDPKNQGSGGSSQEPKDQSGQGQKDQQDKKDPGQQPQDKQDKKDQKDGDEKDKEKDGSGKEEQDPEKKDPNEAKGAENESEKKLPPPKISPKLKQLMSDDRQLQLKVIEQGTRDMNTRKNRDNKDW